ncbi:MAG: hypothetical protein WDZ93_03575 [Candidatus Paceibacterota bacterium]
MSRSRKHLTLLQTSAPGLSATERFEKALCIGKLAEQLMGKELSKFERSDWGVLQETIGAARLFERGERITSSTIADEIGVSRQALYVRKMKRDATESTE